MFEKYYLLEKEGHMVSALYLSFMPSLAWTDSYHTFGYIIFFFFSRSESGSAAQNPEMYCWEHNFHTPAPHWLVLTFERASPYRGGTHSGTVGGTVAHNCIDGNCFLNWSAVGKTAEKEFFQIALLVGKKKKKTTVLAFHNFLPFEAIFHGLQVLVLSKRNTIAFFVSA